MPFRISNKVVSFSRGSVLDKVVSQPKDTLLPGQEPAKRPPPAPKSRLPRVNLEEVTSSTRHASRQSLQKAVDGAQTFADAGKVRAAVHKHLDLQLGKATDPSKPVLILVGEDHTSKTSLLTAIAVIDHQSSAGSPPTVLLEHSDESVEALKQEHVPAMRRQVRRAEQLGAAARASVIHGLLDQAQDGDELAENLTCAKAFIAIEAGCKVQGFDRHHAGAMNLAHRETGMKEKIQAALDQASGPLIVCVGATHLAALREHFKNSTTMAAMSVVSMELADLPHIRRAKSYLLAENDVMVFQPSHALDTAPLNFVSYAEESGQRSRES